MGCNCIYIGRLQAVSCFVPPDNVYYTSATSVSPARSDRKRDKSCRKSCWEASLEAAHLFRSLYHLSRTLTVSFRSVSAFRRLLRYDRRKWGGPDFGRSRALEILAPGGPPGPGSGDIVPDKKMKLRGGSELPKKEGYMINEFNDNIWFSKIYVNSRRL